MYTQAGAGPVMVMVCTRGPPRITHMAATMQQAPTPSRLSSCRHVATHAVTACHSKGLAVDADVDKLVQFALRPPSAMRRYVFTPEVAEQDHAGSGGGVAAAAAPEAAPKAVATPAGTGAGAALVAEAPHVYVDVSVAHAQHCMAADHASGAARGERQSHLATRQPESGSSPAGPGPRRMCEAAAPRQSVVSSRPMPRRAPSGLQLAADAGDTSGPALWALPSSALLGSTSAASSAGHGVVAGPHALSALTSLLLAHSNTPSNTRSQVQGEIDSTIQVSVTPGRRPCHAPNRPISWPMLWRGDHCCCCRR